VCLEEVAERGRVLLDEIFQLPEGPSAQLRLMIRRQLEVVMEYPVLMEFFMAPRELPQELAEKMRLYRQRNAARYSKLIEAGIASGEFSCPNPVAARVCLIGGINQAARWLSHAGWPDDAMQ